jgi:hypothetical protein
VVSNVLLIAASYRNSSARNVRDLRFAAFFVPRTPVNAALFVPLRL